MRIAFVTFDMPWTLLGGVEMHVHHLASTLVRDHGHEVTVFTRDPPPPSEDTPYEVVATPVSRFLERTVSPHYRFRILTEGAFTRRACAAVAADPRGFDVVHFQDYTGEPQRFPESVRVATVHVTHEDTFREGRIQIEAAGGLHALRKPVQAWLYAGQRRRDAAYFRDLDRVVCVSPRPAAELRDAHGVEALVVANGVDAPADLPSKEEARARLDLPPDATVVLYLGRLEPVKRPLSLLNVAGDGVILLFAGSGSLEPGVQEAAEGNADVRFLGRVSEADKHLLLRAADVFALPSRSEGQPIALLEALAHGTPIFTTDGSYVPEALRAYGTYGTDLVDHLDEALRVEVPPGVVPTWRDVAERFLAIYADLAR